MATELPQRVRSISEFHEMRGLPKPEHPLVSVINMADVAVRENFTLILDYYSISIKRGLTGKFRYGQQEYDFNAGVMFFMAPNQVFRIEHGNYNIAQQQGWMLCIHPDFLWNTALAKKIKQYEFFDYSTNEALFLSDKEETIINDIVKNIQQEYHSNIDKFTKNIIISHIENLLSYSERFYHRQFITREKTNHQVLDNLEKLLSNYFNSDDLISKGLPTVQYVAEQLNMSQGYLGSLLRMLTGQNTQQHIHNRLIEKAKEKLSTTNLTVSEIAYELGFEHSQSFSKLFKTKTKLSPMEFRQAFN